MLIHDPSELSMTSTIMIPFSSSTTKEQNISKKVFNSNETSATAPGANYASTIVSSFSHDDFLKMLEKNNTTFKENIVDSFKKAVATQLQLHNDTMMETMHQRFTSFQTVMLQTMKALIINMGPKFRINNDPIYSLRLIMICFTLNHRHIHITEHFFNILIHHKQSYSLLSLTCIYNHTPMPLLSTYHHIHLKKLHHYQKKCYHHHLNPLRFQLTLLSNNPKHPLKMKWLK